MEILFTEMQVDILSKKLNVPKVLVEKVQKGYVSSIIKDIEDGVSTRFLIICDVRVDNGDTRSLKTTAYRASELAEELKSGKEIVLGILLAFEEMVISELRRFNGVTIPNIVRLRNEEYRGKYVVRAKKSTVYNGHDVRVSVTNHFKRKVNS